MSARGFLAIRLEGAALEDECTNDARRMEGCVVEVSNDVRLDRMAFGVL